MSCIAVLRALCFSSCTKPKLTDMPFLLLYHFFLPTTGDFAMASIQIDTSDDYDHDSHIGALNDLSIAVSDDEEDGFDWSIPL